MTSKFEKFCEAIILKVVPTSDSVGEVENSAPETNPIDSTDGFGEYVNNFTSSDGDISDIDTDSDVGEFGDISGDGDEDDCDCDFSFTDTDVVIKYNDVTINVPIKIAQKLIDFVTENQGEMEEDSDSDLDGQTDNDTDSVDNDQEEEEEDQSIDDTDSDESSESEEEDKKE